MKDKPISKAQLKALQVLFSRKGFGEEERHEFIENFTSGRTRSTKELTMLEAQQLFREFGFHSTGLKQQQADEAKQVVKAIYYLSLKIEFLNKGFRSDTEEERQMNYAKINKFCRGRSAARKNIQEMSLEELKQVKKQLEKIARK